MPQPLIDLGGDAGQPPLHIAPANGFVPQTYIPLLRPFMDAYRTLSLPPRALWGDGGPPDDIPPGTDWSPLAADLLAGFSRFALRDVVAMGHSFGGITSLLAAMQEPERFRALILLDPTIMLPEVAALFVQAQETGQLQTIPLVRKAMRRRRTFASVEEAYQRFRSKRLFAQWPDETVRLYAEYGTQPDADGMRRLTWPPQWEAYYYSTVQAGIWDALPAARDLSVPLLIINGGSSETFVPQAIAQVQDLIPQATYRAIEGHGHLFPQSAPAETARVIGDWLDSITMRPTV